MTRERKLTGWPPSTSKPAQPGELARARQAGVTVEQLRHEQQRWEAAEVIALILADDKDERSTFHNVLGDKRRWALHVAEAVLKGGKS